MLIFTIDILPDMHSFIATNVCDICLATFTFRNQLNCLELRLQLLNI